MKGTLVARTLLDLQMPTASLRVINVTQELMAIHRGTTLASSEPVAYVSITRTPETGEVPAVVKDAAQGDSVSTR